MVVALFRPDALMNRVFPEYSALPPEAVSGQTGAIPADRAVRLHVVRWTEYGNRYKLFVIPPDSRSGPADPGTELGVTLVPEDGGGFLVTNLHFNGPAESAGLTFGDVITAIDVEETDRPAKEWIYPLGFLLLALVVLTQSLAVRSARAAGVRTGRSSGGG